MEEIKFRKLNADEVECRIGSCSKDDKKPWCDLLLYKDARVDMKLLDETVGCMNWSKSYRELSGQLYCTIGIRGKDGEWVFKEDVGVESNTEAVKGRASDAFKRAGFCVGIGRELYTAPHIRIFGGSRNTQARVTELGYDENGNINKLTIVGRKNGWVDKRDEVLFKMEGGVVMRIQTSPQTSDNMREAVSSPQTSDNIGAAAAVVMPDDIKESADACASLDELKKLRGELVALANWKNEYAGYFNNLCKTRGWI